MRSLDELARMLSGVPDAVADEIMEDSDPIVNQVRFEMGSDENIREHPPGYAHSKPSHPGAPSDDGVREYSGETSDDVHAQRTPTGVFVGNTGRADIARGQDLGWGTMGDAPMPAGADQPDMQGAEFYSNSIPVVREIIDIAMKSVAKNGGGSS